jgi:hypothetical protein
LSAGVWKLRGIRKRNIKEYIYVKTMSDIRWDPTCGLRDVDCIKLAKDCECGLRYGDVFEGPLNGGGIS